nr:hypothetical protein [uncultured Methanomethylovorans sp.]
MNTVYIHDLIGRKITGWSKKLDTITLKTTWYELHQLSVDENFITRADAVVYLGKLFSSIPDELKAAAWEDIHRLTTDDYTFVRESAAYSIGYAISSISNNYKAIIWEDLHRLAKDRVSDVRAGAVNAIGFAFPYIPDEFKETAWEDLHRLSTDTQSVQWDAVIGIGFAFPYIPDEYKATALDDLYRLKRNINENIRERVGNAIGYIFSSIPNQYKYIALEELCSLTKDNHENVRESAANAIGITFQSIPDQYRDTVWNILSHLTFDYYGSVRKSTAKAIGTSYSSIPEEDKPIAWSRLTELAKDSELYVRIYAKHSLGKISIYKASKSENEIETRNSLNDAIKFFEDAAKEKEEDNPATFCNLLYHTIDVVLFKKSNSTEEVQTYIINAKKEIKGSKSKRKLIDAFEQLAEVVITTHSAKENNIDPQELIKKCSLICDNVNQLMLENKDITPALYDLYKKEKPSFDKTIKEIFDELKVKAKVACRDSKSTHTEYVACSLEKKIRKLDIEDQDLLAMNLDLIVMSLKRQIPDVPENKSIIDKIDEIKMQSKVENQMGILAIIIPWIPQLSIPKELKYLNDNVNNRFDKVDESQHRIELSLEQVHQKLDKSLDKLHTLSLDFKTHGKELESEYIDTFENEIRTLIAERDSETLDLFAQKLFQNRSLLLDEIDKSGASDKDKKESEKSIFELKDLPRKIKDIMISATTDVSKELVVSLIATLILESVFPILGPAAKEVVKILVSVINSRKD